MFVAGSDDGVYSVSGLAEGSTAVGNSDGTAATGSPDGSTAVQRLGRAATVEKVLDAGRVVRVERFDGVEGVFAASETGLYHSRGGEEWTDLGVPRDQVYAVAASPDGNRLYAGTRPAEVYVTDWPSDGGDTGTSDWRELDGFSDLRDRVEWGIPRHDGLAQVRSLHTHPDAPERVVAGVEVGGVHVSDDRGESWSQRRIEGFDAPHTDDVHHVAIGDADTFVASTGSGLYRTRDAGQSWTRLDRDREQRYFREASVHDGTVYAGGALGPSTTWEEKTDHALFESRDGALEAITSPTPDEVVIGWCATGDGVVAATHRGTLLARRDGEWEWVGEVPTPGDVRGRYLPLTRFEG